MHRIRLEKDRIKRLATMFFRKLIAESFYLFFYIYVIKNK